MFPQGTKALPHDAYVASQTLLFGDDVTLRFVIMAELE
jgi:hypothetical protein